jgi:hypothetical protein
MGNSMTRCEVCDAPGKTYSYAFPVINVFNKYREGSVVSAPSIEKVSLCDFHYLLWDKGTVPDETKPHDVASGGVFPSGPGNKDTPTLQQPLYDYSKGKFYTTLKGRLFIEDEDATRK